MLRAKLSENFILYQLEDEYFNAMACLSIKPLASKRLRVHFDGHNYESGRLMIGLFYLTIWYEMSKIASISMDLKHLRWVMIKCMRRELNDTRNRQSLHRRSI